MPTTILKTRDGNLDAEDRKALDALKQRLSEGSKSILLHLHGGLVNQENGLKAAKALSGAGKLSYNAPKDCEQIYIVWRTGPMETLRANWQDLFQNDRLYRALFQKLLGYVGSKIESREGEGRSAGLAVGLSPAEIATRLNSRSDAPFADLDSLAKEDASGNGLALRGADDLQIEGEFSVVLQQSSEFTDAVEDIAAAVSWEVEGRAASTGHGDAARGRQSLARLQPGVRAELTGVPQTAEARGLLTSAALLRTLVKHGVAIVRRVIERLRTGRGHGVHATIVEEILRELYGDLIGAAVWGMMKKDARDHFAKGALGDELVRAMSAQGNRLLVVGHSAGSIWAAAMLEKAATLAGFPKFSMVFLAPAIRMDTFAAAIEKGGKVIDRFRIFTMEDALERRDPVLGPGTAAIYPSSLLYLISGLFEENDGKAAPDLPLLGMQRFLGREPGWLSDPHERSAVTNVRAFTARIANAVVYSRAAGGPGLSTDATAHGDFDNNSATLQSIRSFL